jgi:serine/threonine-protein kinase
VTDLWPADDTKPGSGFCTPSGLDVPLDTASTAPTRYGAGRLLGAGGMGQVVEATDPTLGRKVAMKVMHPEVAATEDGQRRFLREARVQGQLEHPAVVPIYELGQDASGVPYFTMKQVRGVTLESVVDGLAAGDPDMRARFPRRRLLTAFVQVCLAIDFAHSRGVLHRDLKPGNIMVGDFGDVHVLDWGLAQVGHETGPARDLEQAITQATRGGSVFGTPGFMSPEQLKGEPLDPRADVYALGAILFEVLALTPMHPGTADERLAMTLQGGQRSPCLAAPAADVPPELDLAVVRATHPNPSNRTPSARAFAEAVERFLDGDRDLELRRSIAAAHIATARPLVASLDGASMQQRETAMSQLSGALALDPGNAAGLELLRALITHVPATLPPEVEHARHEADGAARAGVARASALRMGMWLALVPLIWGMGPLHTGAAAGVVGTVLGALGLSIWAGSRRELSSAGLGAVMAAIGLAMLGVVAIFGSFVLVPCLASTALVMFAGHLRPRARAAAIVLGMLIVLVPFLLEELALIAPAYEFTLGQIHVVPRLIGFPPGLTKVVLVAATLSSLVMPGVLAGQLRDRLAQAEKKLFLMAWHLERLGKKA